MPAYKFSKLEMSALEYLTKMPEIDEELLAELLKIPGAEAEKLHKKLSKIFQWVVVPNYRLLGWELMFVVYSTMPPRKSLSSNAFDACTHAYLSPEYFLAIGFAQNYSELLRIYEKLCIDVEIQKKDMNLLIFSHELTPVLRFFEYDYVLTNISGGWSQPPLKELARKSALDILSRKLLYHMVLNPLADDEMLSHALGVEKSTVRRKRSFLRKHGYYKPSVNVNLEALGYKGFAFYHLSMPQKHQGEERLFESDLPAFFAVASTNEGFLLIPYTNLDEIFETSVSIVTGETTKQPVSIVNYGYFQFEELNKFRENNYLSVLLRNKNFMFGDRVESVVSEPKRGRNKTNSRNRR